MRGLSPRVIAAGVALVVVLDGLAIIVLSEISDSLTLDGVGAVLGLAIPLGLLNGLVFFIASRLDLRQGTLALGGLLAAINLIAVVVGVALMPGAWVDLPAIVYTGGGAALMTGLLIWLFSIGNAEAEDDYARSRPGLTSDGSGR
jgi:hypothetical protein